MTEKLLVRPPQPLIFANQIIHLFSYVNIFNGDPFFIRVHHSTSLSILFIGFFLNQ